MAFFWKKVKIAISQHFEFFHFWDLSVCFSANFQQLGMELISNVFLWPILPFPGNNSILTKWVLYLWNATYEYNDIYIFICSHKKNRSWKWPFVKSDSWKQLLWKWPFVKKVICENGRSWNLILENSNGQNSAISNNCVPVFFITKRELFGNHWLFLKKLSLVPEASNM